MYILYVVKTALNSLRSQQAVAAHQGFLAKHFVQTGYCFNQPNGATFVPRNRRWLVGLFRAGPSRADPTSSRRWANIGPPESAPEKKLSPPVYFLIDFLCTPTYNAEHSEFLFCGRFQLIW